MTASVVIRALDEEASIGRTLELLEAQSLAPAEVIVVDSGSTDRTVEIARTHGAKVIEIAPETFSFGGALNTGCEAASAEILVALSAHAFPTDPGWLERIVGCFNDPAVCCASGTSHGPDGDLLTGPVRQDDRLARRAPSWGYSNAAGAFRRELWELHPFRADMPATEDKEWALHWLVERWVCLIDPALAVEHSHGKDPLRDQFERARREAVGAAMFVPRSPESPRSLAARWAADTGANRSPWRARLSPRRAARLLGTALGEHEGARLPARFRGSDALRICVMTDRFPALSETFVSNEIRALRDAGHLVTVEATRPADHPDASAISLGASYLTSDSRVAKLLGLVGLIGRHPLRCLGDLRARARWRREETARPLRSLGAVAARLGRSRIEHLHVHFAAEAALDTMRLATLLGLRWSVTAHAYEIFAEPANLREKLERADLVTSGCDYNVRALREIAPGAGRIERIVMGVDLERFSPTRGRRHRGKVVAVGRLVEKKGFGFLLEAVARLDRLVDEVVILGEGALRDELEAKRDELGLGDTVSLPGAASAETIRRELGQATILACPCVVAKDGDRDSMPVVVKEALAMEVPVVATDEVGLPELVRPDFGRLAPPADVGALADAIRALLELPADERARMGAAGRAWVATNANVQRETERLVELIRAVR